MMVKKKFVKRSRTPEGKPPPLPKVSIPFTPIIDVKGTLPIINEKKK